MRIGIDIDDTICETWNYIKPIFQKHFNIGNEVLAGNNYSRALDCTVEEYYQFCKKNIDPVLSNVPIKPDASFYINKLKEEGHEIFFITARSTNDMNTPYETTKAYLDKHNIKYDKLLVNSMKKEDVAKENKIDVLIDDSIKHCTNVSKLGIPVLMVATDYNKQSDFRKVKNWEEIYNVISKGMI